MIGQVIGKRPIGNFHYQKQLAKRAIICAVRVFRFRVECQLDNWPEKGERVSKWVDAKEAAALVEEGGLQKLLNASPAPTLDL